MLEDELATLKLLCSLYDAGEFVVTPKLVVSICILLRDEKKTRPALVNRFGSTPKYFDGHREIDERNLLPEHSGLGFRIGSPTLFIPNLSGTGHSAWVPQAKWWEKQIVKDRKARYLSRKNILMWYRNAGRGAHAATYIEQVFDELEQGVSLGWTATQNGQPAKFGNSAADAQVRQLAYEAIETVEALIPTLP